MKMKIVTWAGDVSPRVKALTVKSNNLSFISGTHRDGRRETMSASCVVPQGKNKTTTTIF